MKIVVIGGTGLIGSKVVARLSSEGHDVVSASPDSGVNTITNEGVEDALRGAAVVVDVTNRLSPDPAVVLDFFRTSTSNLLAAEAKVGVGLHVALSVVGTRQLGESGYFQAKIAQEQLIEASPVPYTIVHATQFFEFLPALADMHMDGDTVRMPAALFQPMAADDVAAAVASAAVAPPVNGTIEVGGPVAYPLDELVRRDLESRGDARKVIADPAARYSGAPVAERTLVPGPDAVLGSIRYEDWAAKQAVA
jgi:uncharacterized protein YbjT (DUF2867 family)